MAPNPHDSESGFDTLGHEAGGTDELGHEAGDTDELSPP
jgi:hypothetical protein